MNNIPKPLHSGEDLANLLAAARDEYKSAVEHHERVLHLSDGRSMRLKLEAAELLIPLLEARIREQNEVFAEMLDALEPFAHGYELSLTVNLYEIGASSSAWVKAFEIIKKYREGKQS